jgi:hypothetical protein
MSFIGAGFGGGNGDPYFCDCGEHKRELYGEKISSFQGSVLFLAFVLFRTWFFVRYNALQCSLVINIPITSKSLKYACNSGRRIDLGTE